MVLKALFNLTVIKILFAGVQVLLGMGIAFYFGVSGDLDAFFVTTAILTFFNYIFLEAQGKAFIPFISAIPDESTRKEQIALIVFLNVLFFSLISLAVFYFASRIILVAAPGLSPHQHSLSTSMLRIVVFLILSLNLGGIFKGVLEYEKRFATAGIIELIQPSLVLITLVVASGFLSVFALPVGHVAAQGLCLILYIALFLRLGYTFRTNLSLVGTITSRYFVLLIPVLFSASLFGLIAISETFIGSFLDAGSISSINYSQRLVRSMPLLTLPLCTIFFPLLSRLANEGSDDAFMETFRKGFIALFTIATFIAFFVLCFAEPIVALLFERGNFTHENTVVIARLLYFYVLVLFCAPLGTYLINAYYSRQAMKTGALLSIASSVVNIGCNFLFAKLWGLYGLAAGASIGYLTGTSLQLFFMRRLFPGIRYKPLLANMIRILIAGGIVSLIIVLVSRMVADAAFGSSITSLVSLVIFAALFAVLYGGFCYFLKVEFVSDKLRESIGKIRLP